MRVMESVIYRVVLKDGGRYDEDEKSTFSCVIFLVLIARGSWVNYTSLLTT
jgi:hypothetical protein